MKTTQIAALSLLIAACSAVDEPDEPRRPDALPTTGETYVVNQIFLPQSAAEVYENALDLDGDERVDNNLGQTLSIVASALGRDTQGDVDDALANGEMMHLLLIGSRAVEGELDAIRVFLGEDTDDDLSNNYDGTGELAVRASSPTNGAVFGARAGNNLDYTLGGEVTLENRLFGAVTLPLVGAQISATIAPDGTINGLIGGAIPESRVENELIPSLVVSVLDDVAVDCIASEDLCCTPGSRGEDWVNLFDNDEDCELTADEVRSNSIIGAITAPDVDLDGDDIDDGLSAGFSFTAVPAQFAVPR